MVKEYTFALRISVFFSNWRLSYMPNVGRYNYNNTIPTTHGTELFLYSTTVVVVQYVGIS